MRPLICFPCYAPLILILAPSWECGRVCRSPGPAAPVSVFDVLKDTLYATLLAFLSTAQPKDDVLKMLPLAATSLTPSSLTMAVSTDPKMATAADSNMFHSTADQLQALSCLTEEAKLYREAAKGVLARPENKDAGPQEKSLILSGRSLGDLLDTLKQEREKNRLLKHRDSTTLSRSAKAAISIVDTLNRFEKAITSMAQASKWL